MNSRTKYCIVLLSILLCVSSLVLYYAANQPPAITPEDELHELYLSAIEDAQIAEEEEIYRDLVPIIESNEELIWSKESGSNRVLVVTLTSWDGYVNQTGEKMNTSREVWVTVVPELQEFFAPQAISEETLTLRLEQLLGLPPDSGKRWCVELWVNPADIYRPSPDPEITDRVAELDFPEGIREEHIKWINDLKNDSYGVDGYPWTRLGYTYDWGNPESEVGLSEFVIKKGAEVTVRSVTLTFEYCS